MSVEKVLLGFNFHPLSEWRAGTGAGGERGIDRAVMLDQDGLPAISGNAVTGLLRDAAEQLAHALDEGQVDRPWSSFVNSVFGDQPAEGHGAAHSRNGQPRPSRLAGGEDGGAARLDTSIRAILRGADRSLERRAIRMVRPGVRIDADTKMAQEDMLRFDEVVRRGIPLFAELELTIEPERWDVVIAFLAASAALIERAGSARMRGLGHFRVELARAGAEDAPKIDTALKTLRELTKPPELADLMPREPEAKFTETCGEFLDYDITIDLLGAALWAHRTLGNTVVSESTIPGTALLPIVANRLRERGIVDLDEAIHSGDLRILPGTPAVGGVRTLPPPASWSKAKEPDNSTVTQASDEGTTFEIFDELTGEGRESVSSTDRQLQPIRSGFVAWGDQPRILASPARTSITHNVIDDVKQRPTRRVGGVYVYDCIAPGQKYIARLRVRKKRADKWPTSWTKAIDGMANLSRRKKLGGRVRLSVVKISVGRLNGSSESVSKELVICLESDAIIRDRSGGFGGTLGDVAHAIVATLNAVAPPSAGAGYTVDETFDLKSSAGFLSSRVIGGWIKSWGLPKPEASAIVAGSCARFSLRKPIDGRLLLKLADEGIGERRAEGFGSIIVSPPWLSVKNLRAEEVSNADSVVETAPTPEPTLSEDMRDVAIGIENIAYDNWVAESVQTFLDIDERGLSGLATMGWTAQKPNSTQSSAMGRIWRACDGDGELFSKTLVEIDLKDGWPGTAIGKLREYASDQEKLHSRLARANPGLKAPGPICSDEVEIRQRRHALSFETFLFSLIRAQRDRIEAKKGG